MQAIKNIIMYIYGCIIVTVTVSYKLTKLVLLVVGAITLFLMLDIYHATNYVPPQYPSRPVPDSVAEIYRNIKLATDQSAKVPPIYQLNTFESYFVPNAFTNGHAIYMTYNLMYVLRNNPDALALIIGHEVAHGLLHHAKWYNQYTRDSSATDEVLADGYGAFLAAKAGYDVCKGARFFLYLKNVYGDNLDTSHPSDIYRYHHLQMAYCK